MVEQADPARAGILTALKTGTRALHQGIEEVVPLLRPGLGRSEYRAYLTRLLGYYRPLERQLAGWRGEWALAGLDFEDRLKTPLLEQDLAALGATAADLAGASDCPALPDTRLFAGAWGALYVLEGSTLGGQIVYRRMQESLGPETALAGRFLQPYGASTGERWRRFTAALTAWSEGAASDSLIVAGARQTFTTLTAWLDTKAA